VSDPDTDVHAFMGGRLTLEQPVHGYRAGMDAALLAAAAASLPGAHAGELGCGVGAALLSVAARRPDWDLDGVERDEAMAAIASRNAARNGLAPRVRVLVADGLAKGEPAFEPRDVIFSNPPFFDDLTAVRPPHPARMGAYVAGAPLRDWLKAMLRLTSLKGRIALIHRADRLGDLLMLLQGRAGDVAVHPVRPHPAAAAKRVVVTARRGSRGATRLFPGLTLHATKGEAAFTEEAAAIFAGAPWPPSPD
jgi:tRNA1(Val) A37 N6-methylase TrmN6